MIPWVGGETAIFNHLPEVEIFNFKYFDINQNYKSRY